MPWRVITAMLAPKNRRTSGRRVAPAVTMPTPWPQPVIDLLKKRLDCSPPCPYTFAASEVLRLHGFKVDRGQARHWAIETGYAHATTPKKPHAPARPWQRSQIGELWHLDTSPHPCLPL